MIEIDNSILDTIIEAKKNNKLAFFIGAGFSKNSETELNKIPLWVDLINDLKASLDVKYETDFLKIAQLYYLKYGEYQYFNKLKKYFEINLEPSKVHKKLFSLLPNLIVTTNWDCLLEQTAIEEGLTYDIVTNDIDLVKSSYFHKIIKMHGDFQHHNIVFKEDDYLKYSDTFPLIENYLKSILSTYVVVFIGYSYSDIDLKLITKWIETKSQVTPPKFLFSTRYNDAEASYLKNHGISFLKPTYPDNYSVNKILIDFFDMISQKNELYRYKNIIEKGNLTSSEEFLLVNFLYQKIKILDELKSIFPIQIKELLSNVSINYHINCYGFYFISDSILTTDLDNLVRSYYKVLEIIFIKNKDIRNETQNIIKKIFNIFKKANIIYIKFRSEIKENEYIDINSYLDEGEGEEINSYLDFFTKGEANDLVFLEDYKELSNVSKRKILSNIKEKSYISLAINSFNNEVAQFGSKFSFDNLENFNSEKTNDEDEIKSFKDYFDFYSLTDKKEYNFINSFLNFNILDNMYYSISERIKKNLEALENIKNGGLSFDSNRTEADLLIKSYLDFMYKNNIAMDNYKNVISLFVNYVDFKITSISELNKPCPNKSKQLFNFSNFSNIDIKLSKVDLYILLNFSNDKTLKRLLRSLVEILEEDDSKKMEVFFEKDLNLHEYIRDCFNNLLSKKHSNKFEKVFSNLILLASLSDWDSGEKLIDIFKEIVTKYHVYQTIESINSFVAFNSSFFKSKNIDFSPYIDFIINLILDNKINGFSYRAIGNGILSNIFNYMSWRKDYSNLNLIKAFLYFLNSPENPNREIYTLRILPYLLYISNKEVKECIYDYIFNFLDGDISETKFELFLLCLIYSDDFLIEIKTNLSEEYLSYFEKCCSSSFMFKQYMLDKIVLELARKTEHQYDFFKKIKDEFNLN
ncbi:SIR2 family protein [Acinetobacter baumannii]|uniref:SIR2 family protein n=1 Tax=Acinetobacter baumannii TaxID=470 RepID=UPI00057026A1|nr:SIR2 family protein [Acinetobacter baumannii]MDN8182061.1 SIR2 family protein [Acinetobacter baumannii]